MTCMFLFASRLLFPIGIAESAFGKRNGTAVLCKQIKQNSDQPGEYCTPGSWRSSKNSRRPVSGSSFCVCVCVCRFNENQRARTRRAFLSETIPVKCELTSFSDIWQVGGLFFLIFSTLVNTFFTICTDVTVNV